MTSRESKTVRLMLNRIPAMGLSWGYNVFSRFYKGQISKGIPVSKKLKKRHEEIRIRAVAKLALSLYHIFTPYTKEGSISRNKIKSILFEELNNDRIRITENVILLSEAQLEYLVKERFHISSLYLPDVLAAARRRWIIKENLIAHRKHRVQRRHRVLKNHGNPITPYAPHSVFGQFEKVKILKQNSSANDSSRRLGDQAQHRQGGDGFSRSGLAHHPEGLTGIQR